MSENSRWSKPVYGPASKLADVMLQTLQCDRTGVPCGSGAYINACFVFTITLSLTWCPLFTQIFQFPLCTTGSHYMYSRQSLHVQWAVIICTIGSLSVFHTSQLFYVESPGIQGHCQWIWAGGRLNMWKWTIECPWPTCWIHHQITQQ